MEEEYLQLQEEINYRLLSDVIRHNYRNPSLTRADTMRDTLITVMTNNKFDKLIKFHEARQTEDQRSKQLAITNPTLSTVGKRVMRRFVKTSRITGITEEIAVENNEEKTIRLKERVANFYAGSSVSQYQTKFLNVYSLIDANAFIAIHFTAFDPKSGQEPICYPVLWPCTQVIEFGYNKFGQLKLLLTKTPRTIRITPKRETRENRSLKETKSVTDYMLYEIGVQTEFKQIVKGRELPTPYTVLDFAPLMNDGVNIKYAVYRYETQKIELPATVLGYEVDPEDVNLKVSPIWAAEPHFRDYMNYKSDWDLTMKNHVYAKLMQYVQKCPGERPHEGKVCDKGYTPTGDICKRCNGNGYVVHKNAQDVIYFPFPDDTEKLIPLDKLAVYIEPEFKVALTLKEVVDELETRKIPIAIFGTELLQRTDGKPGVANTATEVNLTADQVSDTLRPFVENFSNTYKFIVRNMAYVYDIFKGLTVLYEFNSDLAVESVSELLEQLTKANNSGANGFIIDILNNRIMTAMLKDKPKEAKVYEVQRRFMPFNGKTESERVFLLNSSLTSQATKVLYANFDSIIDELEEELRVDKKDFYSLSYKEQETLIDTKVSDIITKLKAEQPTPTFNVGGLPGGNNNPNQQ